MSIGQLFLTLFVALIVFGPNKLPMLARHLGLLVAKVERFKKQAYALWQLQLKTQQLQENQQKAYDADAVYQQNRKGHEHE